MKGEKSHFESTPTVAIAYGTDAHLKLRTNLDEQSVIALQDFTNFLHRWQFIPNPVDVRSWIEPRVLDAALRGRGAVAA